MLKMSVHNALLKKILTLRSLQIFCQRDVIYKGYIAAKMKRPRQTHIIPACKHSGIKNVCVYIDQ